MGEVYRARDARLGRDVAVKVIPASFAADPDRLQRFEQEARAAAALNHPNILAVFDIGQETGAPYIVSELLEGETLRERLRAAPASPSQAPTSALALKKAVDYAVQIACGLAAAHAKHIVHRDLKPENIFLTTDGRVKILDFGLAKLTQPDPPPGASALPTSPPHTTPGLVMGTVGYMAPEQVRGLAADHRADIFALGTILYEVLSGRRAFSGATTMDTMTAILKEDPPELPVSERRIPPALVRIVERCLEKSPDARFQSADDLAFALEGLSLQSSTAEAPANGTARGSAAVVRERVAWAIAAVAVATLGVLFYLRPPPELPGAIRFEVPPPTGMSFGTGLASPGQAVSPDGRRMAFSVQRDKVYLAIRSMDGLESRVVPGSEWVNLLGASMHPFWSPDSRFVAFFADGKLKKLDVGGGPPQVLCDAPFGEGGTWNREGTIVFAPSPTSGLVRVTDTGGMPVRVTTLDTANGESSHRVPWFLPDGRHFVYLAIGTQSLSKVYLGSLDSSNRTELFDSDSKAVYTDGHLLFIRAGTLFARPFDPERLRLTGDAFPVAEDVAYNATNGRAAFSASATGVLTYRTNAGINATELAWFDRSGKRSALIGDPAEHRLVRLSNDGRRVAVTLRDPAARSDDIWIYDADRGVPTRLTTDGGNERDPVWSPDDTRIAFNSDRNGQVELYQKLSNGAAPEELLTGGVNGGFLTSWSPDGRFLLFHTSIATPSGNDLWVLPLSGEGRTPQPLAAEPFNQSNGRFSPDGRWIAYVSNESSRNEVYVRPFPGPGEKVRVSADGGAAPRWRGDGQELFYLAPGTVTAVAVNGQGSRFEVGAARPLFETRAVGGIGPAEYDVSADGQRFLLASRRETDPMQRLTVVVNWTAGLKK